RDLELTRENTLLPVKASSASCLPTLEGILWHAIPSEDNRVDRFALTHRSGRIDAAWTVGSNRQPPDGRNLMVVSTRDFEEGVREMAIHGMGRLQSYEIEGPWIVAVTVLGIRGAMIPYSIYRFSRPAWRDRARLPELILEHVSEASL